MTVGKGPAALCFTAEPSSVRTAPGSQESVLYEPDHQDLSPLCIMIRLLDLHRRDVAYWLEEPPIVEPFHPQVLFSGRSVRYV